MAHARLAEVKNRKPVECATCGTVIPAGATKFVVTSFRRRTNFCVKDKPTPEAVASMAPKSRADRASEGASEWTSVAEELRSLAADAEAAVDEGADLSAISDVLADLTKRLEALSVDTSVAEELADEMRSWAENMEEHFGGTSKYDEVSSCADDLEDVSLPDLPSAPTEATREAFEEFASECEDAAEELDEAASNLEGVSFPEAF